MNLVEEFFKKENIYNEDFFEYVRNRVHYLPFDVSLDWFGCFPILDENNIDKDDCLYIGDTNVDKESALNAGLSYQLVSYGYRTKEELEKMCPNDTLFSSVKELSDYLLKWVNK